VSYPQIEDTPGLARWPGTRLHDVIHVGAEKNELTMALQRMTAGETMLMHVGRLD
jgi:hypothetical protein